jgi:hypothetical protein
MHVVYGAGARIFQPAAHFGASKSKGRRNKYFKGKILFLCSKTCFQLLNQIKLNTFNRCDFPKFIIIVMFHHYDYLPLGAKNPSYASCYTPIGCTSKNVRLLCFHLLHGRNSKYTRVERMAYLSPIYTGDGKCRVAT